MAHISEAAPLQISRFYTGLYTFRNPLIVPIRQMGRRIIELYDAISDGFNMECTNRLTLARRPGYTSLSQTTLPGKVLYFYSFKPSSYPGQIYQVVDTTTNITHFQPHGVTYEISNFWAKFTPALTNFATVGAYLYIAQETIAQKWDSPAGPQQVTNWGIDMYDDRFTEAGHGPSTIANLPNVDLPPWQISGLGGTVSLPRPLGNMETLTSEWLLLTGFAFAFPQPTPGQGHWEIAGFQVNFTVTSSEPIGTGLKVRLLKNGALYGAYRTVTLPSSPLSLNIVILGRPNDTWGGAWTINDVNQSGFGVAFQAVNSSQPQATYTISNVQITAYLNTFPIVQLHAGALVSEVGYFYKYCYGNSHSGHISSPTPPSFFSLPDGVITPNGNAVQVQLVPSPDPQVNEIHVYRTTDGGGNPYFELPTSPYPNGPIGFIGDQALDSQLQIANICPDPHFNDPPPGGAIDPVWFAGRLWMHRHHQLFFASGPDITVGNEAEAWYPVYEFALPNEIIRKYPTPNGMLCVTVDDIYIVRGISTASFTVNEFMRDIGQRTWTAGDSDGTNIYILTSDRQLLLINANGLTSIAASIADRIQLIDPTLAYVSQFRFSAFENFLFVGNGSTLVYSFNMELQAWNTAQEPIGGVGAIGKVESSPGVFQFWRAKPTVSSTISFRDLNSFLDEGVPYPCSVTFGPLTVADFLTLAQLKDIALCFAPTDTRIISSVLANEVFPIAGKQFEILGFLAPEPPELSATPSLSFRAERYTWKSTPLPENINFCFLRMDFEAIANPDELFNWTVGGTQTTGGSALGPPGQLPQLQGR